MRARARCRAATCRSTWSAASDGRTLGAAGQPADLGVDVGAAAAIRNSLVALRTRGCAVLVVSEEIDELFELADRLMVMAGGRLSPAVAAHGLPVDELGRWMAGRWPTAQP